MTDTQVDEPRPLPEPLDDSQTGTPARQAGSVRRTSSIDMVWPGGFGTSVHLVGRARDLVTTGAGEAVVVAEAEMLAVVLPFFSTMLTVTFARSAVATSPLPSSARAWQYQRWIGAPTICDSVWTRRLPWCAVAAVS